MQLHEIEPMFAVNCSLNTSQLGGKKRIKGGKIPGVNDVRPKLPQQAPHPWVDPNVFSRTFVQLENLNVRTDYAFAKRRCASQTDDRVAELIGGKAVDEIHQAIFEASKVKPKNDVAN